MRRAVIIVSLSLLVACQIGTQIFAYRVAYAPALGASVWQARHFRTTHHVYAPWKLAEWTWRWRGYVPQVLARTGLGAMTVVVGLGIILSLPRNLGRRGGPPPMEGHGTTVWATRRDVKKAGLL